MIQQIAPRIYVKIGDITQEDACAIVNAANSSLLGGGGVDGAIHRAGGSAILSECQQLRETRLPDGLPTGEAVSTTAGEMPSRYVIHTVGPIYGSCGDACATLLGNCYRHSIEEAVRLGCETIVFPAISTGIYGYPKKEAARIALQTVKALLLKQKIEVTFIFHSEANAQAFLEANR